MAKCHNLELRCHPLLFCNFIWFNIKECIDHHPIIQKEIGELFAKVPLTMDGWCWLLLNVFVVPKCTGGF